MAAPPLKWLPVLLCRSVQVEEGAGGGVEASSRLAAVEAAVARLEATGNTGGGGGGGGHTATAALSARLDRLAAEQTQLHQAAARRLGQLEGAGGIGAAAEGGGGGLPGGGSSSSSLRVFSAAAAAADGEELRRLRERVQALEGRLAEGERSRQTASLVEGDRVQRLADRVAGVEARTDALVGSVAQFTQALMRLQEQVRLRNQPTNQPANQPTQPTKTTNQQAQLEQVRLRNQPTNQPANQPTQPTNTTNQQAQRAAAACHGPS
eukprot:SAG22_NODE_3565_length_1639_cov_5.132468_1_plen_265_part_00